MTHLVCNATLAPYASDPAQSKGRYHSVTKPSKNRNEFARDRDRIIHSGAFRRLKHKTQVFVYHEGDYFRTRLTHSLEVAQIARSIARALNLHEDLAETVALAHDLGHPPFGHAGEDMLEDLMREYGAGAHFDHNDQAIRIVTELENRHPSHKGLNLTWESLEGLAKHNGPILGSHAKGHSGNKDKDQAPRTIAAVDKVFDLDLKKFASAEAQVAAIADDIAYHNHDLDDGLRAGLFTLEDLKSLPLIGTFIQDIVKHYPSANDHQISFELTRRLMGHMIDDILAVANDYVTRLGLSSVDEVRQLDHAIIHYSDDMKEIDQALRHFFKTRMYRHPHVNKMRDKMTRVLRDVYKRYLENPDMLPPEWQESITQARSLDNKPDQQQAIAYTVMDYVSGMTDRFAILEHRRLFDPYRETVIV